MSEYLHRAGASARDGYQVWVEPQQANWVYSGLKVIELGPGQAITLETGDAEYLVVPMRGRATVSVGEAVFELAGRSTIWGEVTDYLYVPRDATFTLTAPDGGKFALPNAVADEALPVRYCPTEEVRVELRGTGNCSRQVVNYAIANPLQTNRLLMCEVLTPGGNWSSYPPHKHDEESEHEHELEEIYYFEVRDNEHGPGMAFHSTYGTPDRPIEVAARVGSGDLALVPHGWHGPCVAAPGYDLYYLNVMAGPFGPEWKSVDDPCFAWVRGLWDDQPVDPRLPLRVER